MRSVAYAHTSTRYAHRSYCILEHTSATANGQMTMTLCLLTNHNVHRHKHRNIPRLRAEMSSLQPSLLQLTARKAHCCRCVARSLRMQVSLHVSLCFRDRCQHVRLIMHMMKKKKKNNNSKKRTRRSRRKRRISGNNNHNHNHNIIIKIKRNIEHNKNKKKKKKIKIKMYFTFT